LDGEVLNKFFFCLFFFEETEQKEKEKTREPAATPVKTK